MEKAATKPVYEAPKAGKPTVLLPIVCVVLLGIAAFWIGIGVTVGDILWFLPVFRAEASVMEVYWDGQQIRLMPGTPEYELLQEAVFAELPRVRSYAKGVGLSDATLEELRQKGRLLVLHYEEPVRVHTAYNFGASKVFYVPLSGFNADNKRVYNAAQGAPLQLASIEQILAAVTQVVQKN